MQCSNGMFDRMFGGVFDGMFDGMFDRMFGGVFDGMFDEMFDGSWWRGNKWSKLKVESGKRDTH